MNPLKHCFHLLFQGGLTLAGVVQGENFVVTTLTDQGVGSLRAAIASANATTEPDTISFSRGENGTLNFEDGTERILFLQDTLTITQPLEIQGPGKRLLILDGGGDGDFEVTVGENQVFSFSGSTLQNPHRLSDLTIQNGTALLGGGNISVFGSIELWRCEIRNGRAIASNPDFTDNSSVNADGGGLFHSGGNLLIDSCTFIENGTSGNFSQGGGLYSELGNALIRRSRIVANTTDGFVSEGGGIGLRSSTIMEDCEVTENETLASSSGGGGIYTDDDFIARNSTISKNIVGATTGINGYSIGGAFANVGFGNTRFENCTITDNFAPPGTGQGGGISTVSRGEISFFATILIGNDAVDLERIPNASTRFVDLGFNLFGTGTGFDLIAQRQATSTYGILSKDGVFTDLDFYGGFTRTHRLIVTDTTEEISAVDTGPTRAELVTVTAQQTLFDQRGSDFPRVVGERLDIGAYEFQAFSDRDNDGLPDAVEEIVEGLNPDLPDGAEDLDRDGLSNRDEYQLLGIAAINDANLNLDLEISPMTLANEISLSFQASPNREYRLLATDDLSQELTNVQSGFLRFDEAGLQVIEVPDLGNIGFLRLEGQIPEALRDPLPF